MLFTTVFAVVSQAVTSQCEHTGSLQEAAAVD
jgi:hypothetical protein